MAKDVKKSEEEVNRVMVENMDITTMEKIGRVMVENPNKKE